MPFSSLEHVLNEAGRVARRFPLTLLCAGVVCLTGCRLLAYSNAEVNRSTWAFPLLSAALLGLPLTLALTLAAERYRWPAVGRWVAQAGALVLLVSWYGLVPALPGLVWGVRLLVLLVGLHLAVAVVPYLAELRREADTPSFWRYNEALLLRLLTAGLYSGVLYVGCALALVAARELFGWHPDSDVFGYLFILLGSGFNTWFFLAGVPADFAALEQDAPYPKGLKVFTQFVLLPLVVLYGGILYAYLGRIVLDQALPKGWVSVLVLALAVAGIFALLLIHPLRHDPENTWIRTFARWFYRALFPLLGLLAVAIGVRVHAYGLTEERYFVVVLAGWLLGVACYFLWRRGQGIIWLPASLAGLAFLSVAGPWGAFAVAERSQLHQLRELTDRYHLLQNGHLDGANSRVSHLPQAVRARLASLFEFFSERDALARLQPQFAGSLALPDSLRGQSPWNQRHWRAYRPFELSGFDYLEPYQRRLDEPDRPSTNLYVPSTPRYYALGQGRYWLNEFGPYGSNSDSARNVLLEVAAAEGNFRLLSTLAGDSLSVQQRAAGDKWRPRLRLSLRTPIDSVLRRYGRNPPAYGYLEAPVVVRASAARLQVQLFITSITREQFKEKTQYNYSATGLLSIKP